MGRESVHFTSESLLLFFFVDGFDSVVGPCKTLLWSLWLGYGGLWAPGPSSARRSVPEVAASKSWECGDGGNQACSDTVMLGCRDGGIQGCGDAGRDVKLIYILVEVL